jgi:hypothetical protein
LPWQINAPRQLVAMRFALAFDRIAGVIFLGKRHHVRGGGEYRSPALYGPGYWLPALRASRHISLFDAIHRARWQSV